MLCKLSLNTLAASKLNFKLANSDKTIAYPHPIIKNECSRAFYWASYTAQCYDRAVMLFNQRDPAKRLRVRYILAAIILLTLPCYLAGYIAANTRLSLTPSPTATVTGQPSITPSPSQTATFTTTATETNTTTVTPSTTPTRTQTFTPSATITPTPSDTPVPPSDTPIPPSDTPPPAPSETPTP